MLIGDSMSENLMQFLPYSAGELKYIRVNMGQVPHSERWKIVKFYKNEILTYKPDILVVSILSTGVWSFQFLGSN